MSQPFLPPLLGGATVAGPRPRSLLAPRRADGGPARAGTAAPAFVLKLWGDAVEEGERIPTP